MGLVMVSGLGFALVPAVSVGAVDVDPLKGVCKDAPADSEVCKSTTDNISTTVADVVSVLLFVIGVISVLMIIVGGIMYTVSTGDAARISKAKFTIIYAVAGLVVAVLAYAIVKFVVGSFK